MERTKINKIPTCICCSDFHLREDTPICRTDDYWTTQWKKVDFISELQKKYNCIVAHAGDLYDKWKPSPNLLRETIEHLPSKFFTTYGQHDLPQHSLDLVNKCGINVLKAAKKLEVLTGCHWNEKPSNPSLIFPEFGARILVWHKMNYQGKLPWPGCPDPMAAGLLRKYPQYTLIVTGDNHQTFTEEYEGRRLVNPGSLMRMEADEINHKPCVYLWYAEDNSIQQVFIPIELNVISREHIERKEQRDARIDAFISRLEGDYKAEMTFEENLEQFRKVNKVRDAVMEIVYKAIEKHDPA